MVIELTDEQVAQVLVRDGRMETKRSRKRLSSPSEIVAELRHLGVLDKEHYAVLTLDARNQLIGRHVVSVGTVDAALVHPRETFRVAILDNAVKIIVVHNHPSGEVEASEEDRLITKRLATAGKILGIPVADHVIIAGDSYLSFLRQGWMK